MAEPARIRIETDEGRMTAFVTVTEGPALARADVARELERGGIVYGIALDALPDPIRSAHRVLVARGKPPVHGADGVLNQSAGQELLSGRGRSDGGIDFRERAFLRPARAGDVIARYVAAGRGSAGRRVDGSVVPPLPGADRLPKLGTGVRLEPTGEIRASRDGVIVSVEGKLIDVTDSFVHKGDVDFQHGNLDARGSLLVEGDVQADFVASASGDVVVKGHVHGGRVVAGGNATITGSVAGSGEGGVQAGGDLTCHHAVNARLHAGETLVILESAFHSSLAGESVLCERGHGRIVGGTTRAAQTISVRISGSEASVPTLLVVAAVDEEQDDLRQARILAGKAARGLIKGESDRAKGGKRGREAVTLQRGVTQATLELRRRQRELLASAEIRISERAFAGTTLRFGMHSRTLENDLLAGRYRFDLFKDSIENQETEK